MARWALLIVLADLCAACAALVAASSARADGGAPASPPPSTSPVTSDRQDWTSRNYPRSWRPDDGLPDRATPAVPSTVQVAPPPPYERAYTPPFARTAPAASPSP